MANANRVTNANCYVDGVNFLGKIKEMSMPQANFKMVEHSALGLQGVVEFPTGFEKFEAKIMWNSFYKEALVALGNGYKTVNLQVRSSIEVQGASGLQERQPMVIFITCTPKNLPLGDFKQNENAELETNLNVTYFKLQMNGEDVYEVDPMNNIYKVDGVDQLSDYRNHIGQ